MNRIKQICVIILSISFPAYSYGGLLGPSTFDECMQEQLKSMDAEKWKADGKKFASSYCRKRFETNSASYTDIIHKDLEWTWNLEDENTIQIEILKSKESSTITKFKLSFSNKDCDKSTAEDFTNEKTAKFDSWFSSNKTTVDIDNAELVKCIKLVDVYDIEKD